jgi:hypothetical protein
MIIILKQMNGSMAADSKAGQRQESTNVATDNMVLDSLATRFLLLALLLLHQGTPILLNTARIFTTQTPTLISAREQTLSSLALSTIEQVIPCFMQI